MSAATKKREANPTLRDVASRADVSTTIASRVLNDDPAVRVREETRQRVIEAAKELGYAPNSIARSLRKSRSDAIGLVMHNLASPMNTTVLEGVRGRCAEAGYVTLLADSEQLAAESSRLSSFLARGRLAGVILHVGHGHHDTLIEDVSRHVPAVLVNADSSGLVPSARLDDVSAGRTAAEHLIALGHTDVAFVGGPEGSITSLGRQRGYEDALRGIERGAGAQMINAGWTAEHGEAAANAILNMPALPTAIVVANLVTASGVLAVLRSVGVRVPHDVSVVAIHDAWLAKYLTVPLTTVQLPLFELGETAAGLLLDILAGKSGGQGALITDPPPRLIVRESTAAPRASRT
ncbi:MULTISPECIES: LacI family DNA-binding transcriptional regulator [Microbacterium]|uniref:LacI family transcriptional regulator n=1 Tax=Microbacterium wangchenii TaxID=2541726 RepID=A0ABX5SV10_9MICO|nr:MULTISPECIES: LacI family DNA-binding transcriptional regulator [Microbacterium]MCK6065218.1 LacI family transcriptional regulator [Microbacterium sp. EYE_512]QBR88669.1 LacI family transcriptional regulator [Microbacterium wangchenii]TXK20393.1 LacI family transcriptional regulator [Microbacterium wangchenii]